MKTTNDAQRTIPAGSTIEATYWSAPGFYGDGPHFETEVEAIEYAVAAMKRRVARHHEFHSASPIESRPAMPEKTIVELRWLVQKPHGSVDFPASRTTYENIADAEAHLARIAKFSPTRRGVTV